MAEYRVPRVVGERYEATIPDTLDLADRAELALNGLGGSLDPEQGYDMYFQARYRVRPPYMLHRGNDPDTVPKFAESFQLMRTMCGSDLHLEAEQGLMETLLKQLSLADGLYYSLYSENRPWHSLGHRGYPQSTEDFSVVHADGRMLRTMLIWRQRDGDPRWDDRLRALARGLHTIAIHKDDYAYYPDGGFGMAFAYPRSGWRSTREPLGEDEGGEGSILNYHGHQIYGLAHWYAVSGDEQALDLARKLTNFCILPRFWGGEPEPLGVAGAEQGHVDSHLHARAIGLRGMLEYAITVNDQRVKEFVRRSYEYMRAFAIPRLGFVPLPSHGGIVEGCTLGDWVALGIRLSDAGLGDYWDDVDQSVRNHLVEAQLVRADLLEKVSEAGPARPPGSQWIVPYEPTVIYPGQEVAENVIERTLGVFASHLRATNVPTTWVAQCCTANGTQGLYYAWEGIVRCADGKNAQVNLLLNRASPWLDVDSHLPYEGKVVIKNKTAERAAVRVSSWIDRSALRCQVGAEPRDPFWAGNYAVFDALKPGDTITLRFPVVEETVKYTADARVWHKETVHTCTFRGNTLVDITPRDTAPGSYPLYLRDHLKKGGPAPLKTVTRFSAQPLRFW